VISAGSGVTAKARASVRALVGVMLTLAILAGVGSLTHEDAVVIRADGKPSPPGTGEPAVLAVLVRNRLAAFVPVRGSGFTPACVLERQAAGGAWKEARVMPPRSGIGWLLPFQRVGYRVPVDGPGTVRAVVYTGRKGNTPHSSPAVTLSALDFEHPPFAH
jgi:hypothetical protein